MKQEFVSPNIVYRHSGWCPICEKNVEFAAKFEWFRDHLMCSGCGSIPRERALALVLSRHYPDWRKLAVHESSPGARGLSTKLKLECPGYVVSQFFRGKPAGSVIQGCRNENLEEQTFLDQSFDIVITQDVMEHVNDPEKVLAEVARTLKPGGAYLFTTPTYKNLVTSERRALYKPDGSVEYIAEAEYHGNPIDNAGSLVTFHFGYDFAQRAAECSAMDIETTRFYDRHHGIIGEFTEVYRLVKSQN